MKPDLEPVSYMPQQQRDVSKPDHAQEVLDVIFPAGDQATEPVQPGEQPLDAPASSVAAQWAAILCGG